MSGQAKQADTIGCEHGFALLVVLWTLALLAFLVTQMAASARTEARIAFNLRTNMVQEANADGAIYAAAFYLLDRSDRHWNVDGTVHRLTVPGGSVSVRVSDEANEINLNTASPELLRALLLGVGADPTTASELAGAIADWRGADGPTQSVMKPLQYRAAGRDYAPPETPFRSLDELARVLGMTPDLLRKITPHLTIYSTYGPGRASTDPVARGAITLLRTQGGILPFETDTSGERVLQVVATASGVEGTPFTRRAVLRLDPGSKDRPYAILTWDRSL